MNTNADVITSKTLYNVCDLCLCGLFIYIESQKFGTNVESWKDQ